MYQYLSISLFDKIWIQNGKIIDCLRGEVKRQAILIENGVVTRIGQDVQATEAAEIVNVEGTYTSDGWVDAHTHVDWFAGKPGLDPARNWSPRSPSPSRPAAGSVSSIRTRSSASRSGSTPG